MKKHPHRSILSNISGEWMFSESQLEKFKVRAGDTEVFWTCIFSLVWATLSSICSVLIFSITSEHTNAFSWHELYAMSAMIPMLVSVFLVELCLPIPPNGITTVIQSVQQSESNDNLTQTADFWIYLHYFVFRNHPLLSKLVLLRRLAIAVLVLVILPWLYNPVWFVVTLFLLACLYCTAKILYFMQCENSNSWWR